MITFDEIKALIGTKEGRVFYKLIDKIHSVEAARAIILLLIAQKCSSSTEVETLISYRQKIKNSLIDISLLKWIEEDLYEVDESRIEHFLINYHAYDVLDAYDEEKKNNDTEGN